MLLFICWAFYWETNLAPQYNITEEGYIYYYLFSLIQIPFQIAIDILFYNIIDLYHDINFYNYLIDCSDRFEKRKHKWIADSDEIFFEVETNAASLHCFAFSSQYYFSITIAMSGIFLSFFGFQILLSSQDYNVFSDALAVFLAFFWVFICYLIEKLCIMIGNFFKLWDLKTNQVHSDESEKSICF